MSTGMLKKALPQGANMALPAHGLLRIEEGEATAIEVIAGRIWVTGTPASGDIVLLPGGRLPLGGRFPYLVEALSHAVVRLG